MEQALDRIKTSLGYMRSVVWMHTARCRDMGPGRMPTRDLIGYGGTPPEAHWPGGARLAVQFVLNYEEGSERSIDNGDPTSETLLSEVIDAPAFAARHLSVESNYEYGSRVGVWRVLSTFRRRGLPLTVFGVAQALARNPRVVDTMLADGHEIACHGYRWISYQEVDEDTERRHLKMAVEIFEHLTGAPPKGWYTGRTSPNTRRLVVEHGGFLYDSDSYADDLPYYETVSGTPHLIVPYTLDVNDMRFLSSQGFNSGQQFLTYCTDAFDILYGEGETHPKMLSVGLHARVIGRPGRSAALERFLDYVQSHAEVWICRRVDIAQHWLASYPAQRS
jgi:allantoinase